MTEYGLTGEKDRTIYGQEITSTVTENQNNDHYHRSTTSGNTGGSTGSSTGARARVRAYAREDQNRAAMLRGQYVDCCEYYTQSFRRAIPIVVQKEIAERIRDGMSADVIRMAMDETQTAPRPSWAYCRAILKRCDLEGIKTLKDWSISKEKYLSSRNLALNYEQREYTEDMFDTSYFYDAVAEYGDKGDGQNC